MRCGGVLTIAAGLFWYLDMQQQPVPVLSAAPAVVSEPAPEPEPKPAQLIEAPDIAEPVPGLGEQLEMASALTTEDRSYAELLELWGLDAGTGDCNAIAAIGFSCLDQRGSMGMLRQLDRPAVLQLIDDAGATHHVLLKSLDGDLAHLSIGGVDVSHSVAEVTRYWLGQYRMLWQPPNGRALSLLPGTDDANVLWLRQSLERIDPRYASTPANSTVYNDSLEQRVREFQRDHRLEVDGYAGSQTQIIINGLLSPADTPRLKTPRLARD